MVPNPCSTTSVTDWASFTLSMKTDQLVARFLKGENLWVIEMSSRVNLNTKLFGHSSERWTFSPFGGIQTSYIAAVFLLLLYKTDAYLSMVAKNLAILFAMTQTKFLTLALLNPNLPVIIITLQLISVTEADSIHLMTNA